jgi:hypothetical protein
MVAYWGVAGLLSLAGPEADAGAIAGGLLVAALGGGAAAWYLYRKPNVRAYFESRAALATTPRGA